MAASNKQTANVDDLQTLDTKELMVVQAHRRLISCSDVTNQRSMQDGDCSW